jgi:ABC-2 type transport system ATP-binding protein
MKQRIKLAQALVHGPKLLLLDEPTNGLDPAGREDMLELIRSVSHGKGLNVLVSSHLLPDIERVCDRVIVIMRGELRAQGTIKDLKKIEGRPVDVELREACPPFVAAMQAKGASVMPPKRSTYRIEMPGLPEDVARIAMQAAKDTGAQVRGFYQAERSLEDAFLEAIRPSGAPVPPPPAAGGNA